MDTLHQTFKIPNAKLHESDIKFVQKFCQFLHSISGKINVSIEDRFPTRFSILVKSPPELSIKDIKQIDMMSNSIKSVVFNLENDQLKIETMKNGQKKPKRPREIEEAYVPHDYDFKDVDKNDLKHVKSIFAYLVALTEKEFTVNIEKRTLDYKIVIVDLESFQMKDVIQIHEKFSAFLSNWKINFSQKNMTLEINKV